MSKFFPNPVGVGTRWFAGPFQLLSPSGAVQFSTNTSGNVVIAASTSGDSFTVNDRGAFGIAIVAPAAQPAYLKIAGNGNVTGVSDFVILQDQSNNARLFNRANGSIDFTTNSIQRVVIGSSGNVTINAPGSGSALTITGIVGQPAMIVNGPSNSVACFSGVQMIGLALNSTGSNYGFIQNDSPNTWSLATGTALNSLGRDVLSWNATGNITINTPASGHSFTVNSAAGFYPGIFYSAPGNDAPIRVGIGPSGQQWDLRAWASDGRFSIYNASSGTQPLVVSTAGSVTLNTPSSGVSLTINGSTNNWTSVLQASSTTSQSYGALILAGTNTSDLAFEVANAANNTAFLRISGDGSALIGNPSGGFQGLGSLNVQSLFINGAAVSGGTSGTFTGTMTGYSGTVTTTCTYATVGKLVMLTIGAYSGTRNGASLTLTMTGLPAAIQPTTTQMQSMPPAFLAGGSTSSINLPIYQVSGGTITFYQGATGGPVTNGWPQAGTLNLADAVTIFYHLA